MQNIKYKKQDIRHKTGFTLLGTVIAIAIVLIGTLSILTLSKQSLLIIYEASDKLIAVYLAKEGMELVRNERDQNWLRGGVAWNEGIESISLQNLKIDNNFYNYVTGTPTIFSRKTTITTLLPDKPNKLRVEVEVKWRNRSFRIVENLHNWR
jgi:Tfp pilus assembly protein PilV